ncbi:TlpA family protein disulfide reductase [Azospirillum halopraeferens]|uniref:TlpA family protein disulfide reductase n=1 Tax=Azospirillum halopraeferens TaxID=34010 RepID=UPI0005511AF9|nr:TlpA disulfide reductase family protein [Azospirillum halopraeferens]
MRTLAVSAILSVAVGVAAWLAAGAWMTPAAAPTVVTLPAGAAASPAAGTVAAGPERFRAVSPPRPVPDFAFVDGDGAKVTVADFAGRMVLLNLWATWCAPCVKEMPALDRLEAALGGDRFLVLALSVDRGGRDTVQPFLEKLGVRRLGLFLDPGNASMAALSPRGLPTTLLIDEQGREIARLEGAAEWDSPEMMAYLRQHGAGGGGVAPRDRGGLVNTGG